MALDPDKLRELADTLTQDQQQLLRDAVGEGDDLDPHTLVEVLQSDVSQEHLRGFATDARASGSADAAPEAPDGGVETLPDGGVDGGTGQVRPEPPLTRW